MSSPRVSVSERRTQEQRSAETRSKLLDATIDCLVEYGYSGTTTTRVAEKAGVTRGAQVHHFGSRDELVVAAVRHLAAKRVSEAVRELDDLASETDPLSWVLDLLWRLHDGPLFIATVELWVAGRTDPTLRSEIKKLETVVVQNLLTSVGATLPENLYRPMRDFVYTAMDALRGILISGFVDDDRERSLRRWRRASVNLRRMGDPVLETWRH